MPEVTSAPASSRPDPRLVIPTSAEQERQRVAALTKLVDEQAKKLEKETPTSNSVTVSGTTGPGSEVVDRKINAVGIRIDFVNSTLFVEPSNGIIEEFDISSTGGDTTFTLTAADGIFDFQVSVPPPAKAVDEKKNETKTPSKETLLAGTHSTPAHGQPGSTHK